MAAPDAWPAVTGCIGPESPAVWNRLSIAQIEAIERLAGPGARVGAIAAEVGADRRDVADALERRGWKIRRAG